MSHVFQMKMARVRGERIAKGERVGEQPTPGRPVGEFGSLYSMVTKDDGGPEPDLTARYLGMSSSVTMRAPVRKATQAVVVPSYATAADGIVARERIQRAELGIPPDRSDASANAHEHGTPPAPPADKREFTNDQQAQINWLRAHGYPADHVAQVEDMFRRYNAAQVGTVQKGERATVFKTEGGRTIQGNAAKVEGRELHDADVQFISLVKRPANRTPFRVMKGAAVEQHPRLYSLSEAAARVFA